MLLPHPAMCDPHTPTYWPDEPQHHRDPIVEEAYLRDITPGMDERHVPVGGPLVCPTCFRVYPSEDELLCPACGDEDVAA